MQILHRLELARLFTALPYIGCNRTPGPVTLLTSAIGYTIIQYGQQSSQHLQWGREDTVAWGRWAPLPGVNRAVQGNRAKGQLEGSNLYTSHQATYGQRLISITFVMLLVASLVGLIGTAAAEAVEQSSVIDFESGLTPGDTPGTLSVGHGMTGASLGSVSLVGFNPELGGNTAMIFDATCGGQTVPRTDPAFDPTLCSGDDVDLYVPASGNVAIITEDGDASDPDDSDNGDATFTFDFTAWGPGTVTVDGFSVCDVDFGQVAAAATFFDSSGAVLAVVPIPENGDNATTVIAAGVENVASMTIGLDGSGAIDSIEITTDSPLIDLELSKDVAPAAVQVGDETVFTISVINQGPDDATGVVVTDTLPAGLTYVSDNAGGAYDSATGVWTIGDLAVGASATMDFTVTVDAVGSFTNEAEVTAANEEDIDSVPGDGKGDDWDDAVVTAVAIVEASSTIGDFVWFDDDNDQVQDADEKPVSGVTVRITNQATNEVLTQVTNADGKYLFSGLDAGTYLVAVLTSTLPDNYGLTTVGSYTVTVLDDESFLDADFGIVGILPVTGMEIESVGLIGMALLALGGALLGLERRRRPATAPAA